MADSGSVHVQPLGILEIKYPYSLRDMDMTEACTHSSCCLHAEGRRNKRLSSDTITGTRYNAKSTALIVSGAILYSSQQAKLKGFYFLQPSY